MEREKVPIIKSMLWLVPATWSQLRTLGIVFMHSFRKRETVNYPEQEVYLPPRYRGRIVLTRDPDGEERCVACNLCAVACPVDCISLQKGEQEDGREDGRDQREEIASARAGGLSVVHARGVPRPGTRRQPATGWRIQRAGGVRGPRRTWRISGSGRPISPPRGTP